MSTSRHRINNVIQDYTVAQCLLVLPLEPVGIQTFRYLPALHAFGYHLSVCLCTEGVREGGGRRWACIIHWPLHCDWNLSAHQPRRSFCSRRDRRYHGYRGYYGCSACIKEPLLATQLNHMRKQKMAQRKSSPKSSPRMAYPSPTPRWLQVKSSLFATSRRN